MKKVRVFQIGCGKMSKYIMKYVYDKNGEIVGAVDVDPQVIGLDIGKIMETEKKGVKIEDVSLLDELLKQTKPDIAVVTTRSFLNDIANEVRICVCNNVHVITTCEEAFFAENSNPQLFFELDALAKAHHVSIVGAGYQDIFWGNMIYSVCTSMARITKIKGRSSYNVEDYGIALAQAHGAGLTSAQFEKDIAATNDLTEEERKKKMEERTFFPSYMWNVVGWLAEKLHLHINTISQKCVPVLTDQELQSDTLNMTLMPGMVRGMNAIVTATTKENILLEIECIGKVYTKDEEDINEWTIFGEPTTVVKNDKPETVLLTCADVVNRIPQVLKAKSGFITTVALGEPIFVLNDFNNYL